MHRGGCTCGDVAHQHSTFTCSAHWGGSARAPCTGEGCTCTRPDQHSSLTGGTTHSLAAHGEDWLLLRCLWEAQALRLPGAVQGKGPTWKAALTARTSKQEPPPPPSWQQSCLVVVGSQTVAHPATAETQRPCCNLHPQNHLCRPAAAQGARCPPPSRSLGAPRGSSTTQSALSAPLPPPAAVRRWRRRG